MRISLNWLADYVQIPVPAEELAARLTMVGLEVEAIERLGSGLEEVVVARIIESEPHPSAEKLSCVKVDIGALAPVAVVCGAKNYSIGDRVPFAQVGAVLPGGVTIQAAKLRGVESFGMLCSAKELGLDDGVDGLLILDPDARLGQPIADALGLRDIVFEINVTPNRGDCLSHLGVAREVAAIFGLPLRLPEIAAAHPTQSSATGFSITIDPSGQCGRYAARRLEEVTIGPSPRWMQSRLRAVGVRALSNAVDVTNYVLFECGQPLHAFDLDKLDGGRIQIRNARPDERMTTLDGKDRALHPEDVLVCDARGPVAIAGVMGGASSEVSSTTRRILIESAAFAPTAVRRTAIRHNLRSEASYRFERGVDPAMVAFAQDRACCLMGQICGASVAPERWEAGPPAKPARRFRFDPKRVQSLLGASIPSEEVRARLTSLGCQFDGDQVIVPSWRLDVEGEADCVEEVARQRGFDSSPARIPRASQESSPPRRSRTWPGCESGWRSRRSPLTR